MTYQIYLDTLNDASFLFYTFDNVIIVQYTIQLLAIFIKHFMVSDLKADVYGKLKNFCQVQWLVKWTKNIEYTC